MDLTNAGEVFGSALVGGASGAGIIYKIASALLKGLAKEAAEEAMRNAHASQAGELDKMAARLDHMADTMEEHGMICRKLENADNQTKLDLIQNMHAMGEKAVDFREQLRMEFVSKDAVDGRIIKALSEHCRSCPRRITP